MLRCPCVLLPSLMSWMRHITCNRLENTRSTPTCRCELTNVSMTDATCLPPDVTGLYLSACLTPAAADALSANLSMRLSVAAFAVAGGIVYAEEAGLAYLSTSVRVGEETFSMAGVLPMHVIMHEEPQARGYVRLRVQPTSDGGNGGAAPLLLQPGAWLRGIADTCLEVREEVPTRGLGRATRLGPLKVAQLFEALLVDPPAASGSGQAIAQASQMHGIDTVAEGYALGTVAATLVHVAFASHMVALQPLVTACAARDAWVISTAAAQHAAVRRRAAALSHGQRRRHATLHPAGAGYIRSDTSEHHPLVRLSGESASAPASTTSSPSRSITPPTSASTRSGEQHCVSPGHPSASAVRLMTCISEPLSAVSADGEALRAVGEPPPGHGGVTRPRDIPAASAQRLPLVGSVPDNLRAPLEDAHISRSASYSALRPTGTQWWMQPLPRVRMLSGWEVSATTGPLWPASSFDSTGAHSLLHLHLRRIWYVPLLRSPAGGSGGCTGLPCGGRSGTAAMFNQATYAFAAAWQDGLGAEWSVLRVSWCRRHALCGVSCARLSAAPPILSPIWLARVPWRAWAVMMYRRSTAPTSSATVSIVGNVPCRQRRPSLELVRRSVRFGVLRPFDHTARMAPTALTAVCRPQPREAVRGPSCEDAGCDSVAAFLHGRLAAAVANGAP